MNKEFFKRNPLLFLSLFYFIFRLILLTKLPIFNDESIYISWGIDEISRPENLFYSLIDAKPPLLMWFFGFAWNTFPDPLFGARFVSVLTGFSSALGLYFISRRYFDKKTAVLSFIFFTVIPLFSFFDRQALMESALIALSIWSFYMVLRLIETKKILYSILLGILFALGLYIKGTVGLIIISFFIVFALLRWKKNIENASIFQFLFAILVSQILLIPLYSQSNFWSTLYLNSRYTLSISELIHFPLLTWFRHIIDSIQISFWYLSPLVLISIILGIIYSKKNKTIFILSVFLGVSILLYLAVSRYTIPRYISPFLPLTILFASLYVSKIKNIFMYVIIFSSFIVTTISIVSPITFFNLLASVTSYSQKVDYVTGWTSGYGIPETIDFVNQMSHDKRIIVATGSETANPNNAILAYYFNDPKVYYLKLDLGSFEESGYSCITSPIPLYLVRQNETLDKFKKSFLKVREFQKPENKNRINIYTIDTSCKGKVIELAF